MDEDKYYFLVGLAFNTLVFYISISTSNYGVAIAQILFFGFVVIVARSRKYSYVFDYIERFF